MKIPAIITQGDSVTWKDAATQDSFGNAITSADWTLTWNFAGPTAGFSVISEPDGPGWITSLSSEQTGAMTPGTNPPYFWHAVASKGTDKITIGSGRLVIDKSLANLSAGYDGRTQAEIDLAAVQSAIRDRVSGGGIQEYWIGTRRLRNEPMSELIALESRLKLIVSRERRAQDIANGLGDPFNVFVRFG